MKTEERISKFTNEDYQKVFGVKKSTFEAMLKALEEEYQKSRVKGGRPFYKLSVLDKLAILLIYYREYCSFQYLAFVYNVSRTAIFKSIQWVEKVLTHSRELKLPSKNELRREKSDISVIFLDATEIEIQRPKKNKKNTTQGRKSGIP